MGRTASVRQVGKKNTGSDPAHLPMSHGAHRGPPPLPRSDNAPGALAALRAANLYYRNTGWPKPFDATEHRVHLGDARDLSWIPDRSVHLIVTSPPYWTLKKYETRSGQLGDIEEYGAFLTELAKVWEHCSRVLVEGGRVCCVVGDVCIPRRKDGHHRVMPLHADIQVGARRLGLDCLTPILWHKIANGVTEVEGNGAGFYGKPYQPGAVVKNDVEYILFLRKPGEYRKTTMLQKALSLLAKDEMQSWFRSFWTGYSRGFDAERSSGAISGGTGGTPNSHVLVCWRHDLGPVSRDWGDHDGGDPGRAEFHRQRDRAKISESCERQY